MWEPEGSITLGPWYILKTKTSVDGTIRNKMIENSLNEAGKVGKE